MKIPVTILALVAVILGLAYLFAPPPGPDAMQARTDLPWQVTPTRDGGSRVFDIDLGRATLNEAMQKFGALEGLAVFEPKQGAMSLEGYFGTVRFGPLTAKIIVGLDASPDELAALKDRSAKREGSPSGDWKYRLSEDSPSDHANRRVTVITYIPGTRGLDADFFRERFGEPSAWLTESEHAVSWFYPERGLSILIDSEAGEALEYLPPRDFRLPDGVTLASAPASESAAD